MDRITLTVHVEYDPEAKVWYTAHSQPLRGCLNLEACWRDATRDS